MNSDSNRVKKHSKEGDLDRISGLPDEILGKILSHIPTKEAVATSILSNRWKYVWISLSMLHFDDKCLCYYWNRDKEGDVAKNPNFFKGFVDRVLMLCNSTVMRSFSFSFNELCNFPYVCGWISAAIVKFKMNRMRIYVGVEDFKYELCKSSCWADLPENMFISETLECLELSWWNVCLKIPTSFHLPNLKFLQISMFNPSLDFTEHLFSSCPLLEKLHFAIELRYTEKDIEGYEEERKLVVSSNSLRELEVFWTVELPEVNYDLNHNHKVLINCPNLVYLDVHDEYLARYVVENLPQIAFANIDLGVGCICSRMEDDLEESQFVQVINLFESIRPVKTLCLSHATMCVLHYIDNIDLAWYLKLTTMEIGYCHCYNIELLLLLLDYASNLKNLILNKIRGHTRPEELPVDLPDTPCCLIRTLETIQIFGLDGEVEQDIYLITFLLQKAGVLKSMKLSSLDKGALKQSICRGKYIPNNLDSEKVLEFRNEVLKIPKASKNCAIEFDGDFLNY